MEKENTLTDCQLLHQIRLERKASFFRAYPTRWYGQLRRRQTRRESSPDLRERIIKAFGSNSPLCEKQNKV